MQIPREESFVTNITSRHLSISDVPALPQLKPGQRIDLLAYASKESISRSRILPSYIDKGWISTEGYIHTHDDKSDVGHTHEVSEITDIYVDSQDLNKAGDFFAGTGITSSQANVLIGGGDAGSLHTHSFDNVSSHNFLSGIQGGSDGQFYHISFDVYDKLPSLLDGSSASGLHSHILSDISDITTSFQNLNKAGTFFSATNITSSQANILIGGGNADSLHVHSLSGDHNSLSNIQGGSSSEYYHLSLDDYNNFSTLVGGGYADSLHTHLLSIDDLSDVDISGITTNQVLSWSGSEFVAADISVVVTDHTDLTNLGWTISDHSGTANYLAGFGSGGEAAVYDPSGSILSDIYWKNDGSSSATGDWDLGVYDITATELKAENIIVNSAVQDSSSFFSLLMGANETGFEMYNSDDTSESGSPLKWYISVGHDGNYPGYLKFGRTADQSSFDFAFKTTGAALTNQNFNILDGKTFGSSSSESLAFYRPYDGSASAASGSLYFRQGDVGTIGKFSIYGYAHPSGYIPIPLSVYRVEDTEGWITNLVDVRVGSDVKPTVALDVTGDVLISSSLGVSGLGTFGSLDVDTINLNGNVISDSTGVISFNDDNVQDITNLNIGKLYLGENGIPDTDNLFWLQEISEPTNNRIMIYGSADSSDNYGCIVSPYNNDLPNTNYDVYSNLWSNNLDNEGSTDGYYGGLALLGNTENGNLRIFTDVDSGASLTAGDVHLRAGDNRNSIECEQEGDVIFPRGLIDTRDVLDYFGFPGLYTMRVEVLNEEVGGTEGPMGAWRFVTDGFGDAGGITFSFVTGRTNLYNNMAGIFSFEGGWSSPTISTPGDSGQDLILSADSGFVYMWDNDKFSFGDAKDFSIYCSGSEFFIKNEGSSTGDMVIEDISLYINVDGIQSSRTYAIQAVEEINTSGTDANSYWGGLFQVQKYGSANLTNSPYGGMRGLQGAISLSVSGSGVVSNASSVVANTIQDSGSFTGSLTNYRRFHGFDALTGGSVPITNYWGVLLEEITSTGTSNIGIEVENISGATNNYAIKTGTGVNLFGDAIYFTQTDGNEFIDSLDDGYMDYGATIAHRFNNDIDVNGSASIGGTSSGMSVITQGLTVNNGNGNTVNDDFIAKTNLSSNAFVVDASLNEVLVSVVTKIGDGGTLNYSEFEADGTLEFHGDATVWNDINVGALTLFGPPGQQPGTDQFVDELGVNTGIYTYGVAVGESLSGSFELEHDYKEGSDIFFHLHWQGKASPTGADNVRWQLAYTIAKDGETLDEIDTILIETEIDIQYDFKFSGFAAITGTNFEIGDQFLFTIERIAASANEYGGEALLATLGIHYQIDTVGSRQMTTK